MAELVMKYGVPAEDSEEGWENYSLPLGCGHFGVSVFGIVENERLQITENSVLNMRNLTNAAEVRVVFPHTAAEDYERGLRLDDATAYVKYACGGVSYIREYFTSYPDRVLAMRFTASETGALSFDLRPYIPFVGNPKPERARTGFVFANGDTVILTSTLEYYRILFAAAMRVVTDGKVSVSDGVSVRVTGATRAEVYFSCGTNYVLSPRVFLEEDPKKKLDSVDPLPRVRAYVDAAVLKGYDALRDTHVADYHALFKRAYLDLGGDKNDARMTDERLKAYAAGEKDGALEAMYFQFGRYMLIASSRQGCLPPNLQGVWNCHEESPWGSGYWHNINIQMNYWPVFSTNLSELFASYADFNEAFRPRAALFAGDYIRATNPENYTGEGDYGWSVGTAVYPYIVTGGPGGHSGPGTGALTTKLFWDWWEFTRDREILKDRVYPALSSMSRFLCRCVRDYDGVWLSSFSASPEQEVKGGYYHTVGCAFDQQMLEENGRDLLEAASLLGASGEDIKLQEEQIGRYRPVEIGLSGQVKEYGEENYYGEIGEYDHRHISQLVALCPGRQITKDTPAWMDAAKVTLTERTDDSTGWALAHRLNAWARTGDGAHAYRLLKNLIGTRTLPNLWDTHSPFQIDGSFGGTSGIAEMLLQSHAGFIEVLPALPPAWDRGSFSGLLARGNFTVSVSWANGRAEKVTVVSNVGGELRLRYGGLAGAKINLPYKVLSKDTISVMTVPGDVLTVTDIPDTRVCPAPENLRVDSGTLMLSWEGEDGCRYSVWRNTESAPNYTLIASGLTDKTFADSGFDFAREYYVTYKVTAKKDGFDESDGPTKTLSHASRLYKERYMRRLGETREFKKTINDLG